MNKRYSIFLVLISCVLSIKGMDGGSNELSLIELHLSDGMSYNIEQWKIPYFDMVHRSYIFCQNNSLAKVVIPNVSYREMRLANNMLNAAHMDLQQTDPAKPEEKDEELKCYFNSLSTEDKKLLITAVGEYDNNGKRKLRSPYLTEKLTQIHFNNDIKTIIDGYLHDVKDDIRIFFTQNIVKENGNSQKSLSVAKPLKDILQNDVHRTQICIDGTMSYNGFGDPIPLSIGKQIYATYASHFPSDTSDALEFRITSAQPALRAGDLIQPLSSKCSLWIIDREKNVQNSFIIEHQDPIKGCFFSENEDKSEHYVVTYSDHTLCFSTITGVEDGEPVLHNNVVPLSSSIVAITPSYKNDMLYVCMYEKLQTTTMFYSMKGSFIKREYFLFAKRGVLEQIVCCPAGIIGTAMYNNNRKFYKGDDTGLCIGAMKNDEIFLYRFGTSKNYRDDSDQQKIFRRMYSPDGKLLFHILYPKMYEDKKLHVGIHIYDVESGKWLMTGFRPYNTFTGIGFSSDGTELVEFDLYGWLKKIPIFSSEDQQCIQEFRDKYLCLGNIFLLRQVGQLIEYMCQLVRDRQTEKLDKNNLVFILQQKMFADKNGAGFMLAKIFKNKISEMPISWWQQLQFFIK